MSKGRRVWLIAVSSIQLLLFDLTLILYTVTNFIMIQYCTALKARGVSINAMSPIQLILFNLMIISRYSTRKIGFRKLFRRALTIFDEAKLSRISSNARLIFRYPIFRVECVLSPIQLIFEEYSRKFQFNNATILFSTSSLAHLLFCLF